MRRIELNFLCIFPDEMCAGAAAAAEAASAGDFIMIPIMSALNARFPFILLSILRYALSLSSPLLGSELRLFLVTKLLLFVTDS